MMADLGKGILPILTGGGGCDQLTPMILGMLSKDKEGGLGGSSGMWIVILLVILLAGGRGGGLFGCETAAAAAAAPLTSSATCSGFLELLNAISETNKSVAISTGAISQNVDNAASRITAAADAQFAVTNANLNETKGGICRLGDMLNGQLAGMERSQTNGFASVLANQNSGFNGLDKTIYCTSDNLKAQMINGMNQLQSLGNQQFNALSAQNSQSYCNLSGQIKEVNCNVTASEERILAAITSSQKDSVIAAQNARINELERAKDHANIDIAIGNRINSMIGSRLCFGGFPGNGNGNGNGGSV